MGDDQDGGALGVDLVEELDDARAGGRVEVAGRLVREEQRRVADHGARDGDALSLAAGELVRLVVVAVGEPDAVEDGPCALAPLGAGDARIEQPVGHVVERGDAVGQVELLEHEPDPVRAHGGKGAVGEVVHVHPFDGDRARGGPVEGPDQVEEGRFAGAAGADERDQFALPHGQAHPRARQHRRFAVTALDVAQLDDGAGLTAFSGGAHSPGTTTL
ncbi:hypothetical protein BGM09_06335 [Streptomyces sp. CBMA29]|nr:hypothetical protein [Streptomyces sp. CBMA29]